MTSKSLIAFVEWLQVQPKRESLNIALLTAIMMPGCNIDINNSEVTELFISWVIDQSKHPSKSMGTALSLRAIIDFSIMDGITHSEQWKEQSRNLDLVIEKMKANGFSEMDCSNLVAHQQSLQFKSAQSQKMKASWLKLCEEHFTRDAISKKLI